MPFAHRLLAILVAGFAAASSAHADPARVKALVADKAATIGKIQGEHIAELRVMAQIPALRDYFQAPEKERPNRMDAVEKALAGRQMGSELCLIDGHGSEHLRAVRGRVAPESELAQDEDSAPFFRAGIRLPAGGLHVSTPYLSPDVEEWVIGYVVPVLPGEAILHFEHTLRELQAVASQGTSGSGRFVLLIDPRGYVVADSRTPVALGLVGSEMEAKAYFKNIKAPQAGYPAELSAALTARAPKELKLQMDGKPYDVSWQEAQGLFIVGFDG
jgi:hypothetical protein